MELIPHMPHELLLLAAHCVIVLTLKGQTSDRENHPFCYHGNQWFKKNPKVLIGSQTTIEDLPFSHKYGR